MPALGAPDAQCRACASAGVQISSIGGLACVLTLQLARLHVPSSGLCRTQKSAGLSTGLKSLKMPIWMPWRFPKQLWRTYDMLCAPCAARGGMRHSDAPLADGPTEPLFFLLGVCNVGAAMSYTAMVPRALLHAHNAMARACVWRECVLTRALLDSTCNLGAGNQ